MPSLIRLGLAAIAAIAGVVVSVLVYSALHVVGTDDVTESAPFTVTEGAHALVLDEQIVPYSDTTVTLTASGDSELFLGTANGVDTQDYLTGVAQEEITDVDFSGGISHRFVAGSEDLAAAPEGLDWWTDTEKGKTVSTTIDLEAEPETLVVMPQDPKATLDGVKVSMTMDTPGVFSLCIVGMAVALVLFAIAVFFVFGWWNSRLRPPPRRRLSSEEKESRRARLRSTFSRPRGGKPRTRSVLVAGPLVATLALSGCSVVPIARPHHPDVEAYEKPALEPGDAGDLLGTYSEDLDKALHDDPDDLDAIQTSPVLERTKAEIEVAKADDASLAAVDFSEVVAGGPSFTEYPMWFLAFATPADRPDTRQAMLVTRASAAEHWKVEQSLFVPAKATPVLQAEEGTNVVERAGESHTAVAATAGKDLASYLETGKAPKSEVTITPDGFSGFLDYVKGFSAEDAGFEKVKTECTDFPGDDLAAKGLVTENGTVSLGEMRCTISFDVPGDYSVDMGDAVEAVMTTEDDGSHVSITTSLPYMLTTDGKSAGTVTGSDWFLLSAETK